MDSYTFLDYGVPAFFQGDDNIRDVLVSHYFWAGYTYDEICSIMNIRHCMSLSNRTLHRVLRRLNLRRQSPDDATLLNFLRILEGELQGSGNNLGCRAMRQRLLSRYNLVLPRDVVLEGQRLLDPDAVEMRRQHRLRRRLYHNDGPNFAHHIDQYDKLKSYGFAIHGAIDGFSRRILWLRVARTNNDPKVVASYFVSFLQELGGIPRCIQMDRGTENVLIEDIQVALNSEYGVLPRSPCVIYSTSPHNQRIERFWRTLFDMMASFWVDTFKHMVETGVLDCTSPLHVECLRFSLTPLIQSELDDVRKEWNQHHVRASANVVALPGKPDLLYFLPQLFGVQDFRNPVPRQDLHDIKEEFTSSPNPEGCEAEFAVVCKDLMSAHRKTSPMTATEGLQLFQWLRDKLS